MTAPEPPVPPPAQQPVWAAQPARPAPPAPVGSRPPRVYLIVAAALGVVVGAVVVGVLWVTVGGSSGGIGGSTTAVSSPAKLGDYQRFVDLPLNQSGPGKTTAARTADWNSKSTKQLSDAYGGAAAVVDSYASGDLSVIFSVQIVRAASPELYVPYQDPKELGLAAPEQEVKRFGAVQCIVHNQPTSTGSETPAPVIAVDCQRTGDGLTVRIPTVGGDLGKQPDRVAALVDEAFTALH